MFEAVTQIVVKSATGKQRAIFLLLLLGRMINIAAVEAEQTRAAIAILPVADAGRAGEAGEY